MENPGPRQSVRRLLPKPYGHDTINPPPERTSPPGRREKVKRACERCRNRRSRCDGATPSCSRCQRFHSACVYPMSPKVLKRRFEDLEVAYRQVAQNLETINNKHRAGDRSADVGDELSAHSNSAKAFSSLYASHAGYENDDSRRGPSSVSHLYLPLSRWTTVSEDDGLLNHLFTLFWTWEATLTRVLHRDLLIKSLLSRRATENGVSYAPGDASEAPFCSELLINTILAVSMASFFKGSEDSTLTPHGAFANEATRLQEQHDGEPRLPLLQGIVIMSAYEQAFASPSKGVTLYFDTLASLRTGDISDLLGDGCSSSSDDATEQAVNYIASGFYYLDTKMSLTFDHIDFVSRQARDRHNSLWMLNNADNTGALWTPFPISAQPRIAYYSERLRAERELDGVAADILLVIQDRLESPVPDYLRAKDLYHALLQWKDSHSECFLGPTCRIPAWMCILTASQGVGRFNQAGEHRADIIRSYFHLLAIKLLRAFTGLSFLEFGDGMTARFLSQSHSEAIISSLWNFYAAFGMRHDPWLLHVCYSAVATLLLDSTLPGIYEEPLSRGFELLYHMGQYMPEANRLVLTIWNGAQDKNVRWPTVGKRFLKASLASVQRTSIVNAFSVSLSEASIAEPLQPSHRVSFTRTVDSVGITEGTVDTR